MLQKAQFSPLKASKTALHTPRGQEVLLYAGGATFYSPACAHHEQSSLTLARTAVGLGVHTSWGGGHLRHPDFPRTIGKSWKYMLSH